MARGDRRDGQRDDSRAGSRADSRAGSRRAAPGGDDRDGGVRRAAVAAGTGFVVLLLLVVALAYVGRDDSTGTTQVAASATTVPVDTTVPVTEAPTTTLAPTTTTIADPCPPADGTAERKTEFTAPPPSCIDATATYVATVKTSEGTMKVTLDAAEAPKTVNNFVYLARYHFYDGLTIHRVVPGFIVQGGDPAGDGSGGPGYEFEDELPSAGAYKVGSVAMANAGPNTNGSQFFIVSGQLGVDNLTPDYTLFGQVTSGLDVLKAIDKLGGADEKPTRTITIESVTITQKGGSTTTTVSDSSSDASDTTAVTDTTDVTDTTVD